MISMRMFARLAFLVAPLALGQMAPAQDEAKAPKERTVRVTEGRVTVVEDDPKPADRQPARRSTTSRTDSRTSPDGPALGSDHGDPITVYRRATQIRGNVDPLASRLGIELAEADDALRAQLQLPTGQGVVVVTVKADGFAGQSGIKVNDVILSLGDLKVRGVNPARARLLGLGKQPIEVKLIRAGQPVRLELAGPEHGAGAEPSSPDFWIGVPVSPVDATLRSQLSDLPGAARGSRSPRPTCRYPNSAR